MISELATIPQAALVLVEPRPRDQNPAAVYLAGLQPTGQRTQAQALKTIARLLGAPDAFSLAWSALRFQHTAAIRSKLAETYKPATANKMLTALRQVLKAAWRLGQMTAEEYQRAADLDPVTGETLPAGRELTAGEIVALMQACQNDPSPAGARDAAIIGLMYAAGLRRQEVVSLALSSYDSESGKLVLTGKRSKQRAVYLLNGAADAMADWLEIRGSAGSALFVAVNKGGEMDTTKPLSDQAIYNLLGKRAAEAGVKDFSPHDLRRTFISDLLDKGADIATVAKMAGHANVQTTARYDRRPEEAKRKAASLLHVPYSRRGS
jgi:integrase/recombinase XerD